MNIRLTIAVFGVVLAHMAVAQDASGLADGQSFAASIAPTSNGQIVNPGGVNATSWGTTTVPASQPQGMGGFSTPLTDSSLYSNATGLGLGPLGVKAQSDCAGYVATGQNPARDQECAAINFLANRCLNGTVTESAVMAKIGVSQNAAADCDGTYGAGKRKFNFNLSSDDPMFGATASAQANAATSTDTTCTQKTVVTTPAAFSTNTCTKSQDVTSENCSQYLNTTITTTSMAATETDVCPSGTQIGNYCQSTTTAPATALYVCSSGETLSGTTCTSTNTTTLAATTSGYSCPSGYSLSGSTCSQTTTTTSAPTASYSCSSGTLSGTSCITVTSSPATPLYTCAAGTISSADGLSCTQIISRAATSTTYYSCGSPTCMYVAPSGDGTFCYNYSDTLIFINDVGYCVYASPTYTAYSCPNGGTLSGSMCVTTTTTSATISGYSCPTGQTLSGSSCTTTTTSAATVTYSCPSGTMIGSTCTQTTTTTVAATPIYSCPAGATLVGSNCVTVTNVSTPATISGYSCPAGATLVGTNCVTTTTTSVVIQYSCVDGSAPVNGICYIRSAQYSWTNTCKAYETSAGITLGTP